MENELKEFLQEFKTSIDTKFENLELNLGQQFNSINEQFKGVNEQFKEVNEKLDKKANTQDIINFENSVKKDINVLYDGLQQTQEGIKEIKQTVKEISKKVDNQEVEIRVLKAVK